MSPRFEAIALPRVRYSDVRAALEARGVDWAQVGHIARTRSLEAALGRCDATSLRIATLIDLIVLPGMSDGWGTAPFPRDPPDRQEALQSARVDAAAVSLQLALRLDDSLRRHVNAAPAELGASLIAGRRTWVRTVRQLIAAGVAPGDVHPDSDLTQAAVELWKIGEHETPQLAAIRNDLWLANDEATNPSARARVRDRTLHALSAALDVSPGGLVIHHGFHFYSPPQWALFRLLRDICQIDQIFVVHDDLHQPVFESWRRFFDPALDMPAPQYLAGDDTLGGPAAALRDALAGRPVDGAALGSALNAFVFRDPTEAVRHLRQSRFAAEELERPTPLVFAADALNVDRVIRRLGGVAATDTVDLAQLPLGSFLLGVHNSVVEGGVELSAQDLLDIAASGLVGPDAAPGPIGALRRSLPYFSDCTSVDDWRKRAEALLRVVTIHVPSTGGRNGGDQVIDRTTASVTNPLLRVPWADVSVEDARAIAEIVRATTALLERIGARTRVRVDAHLQMLRHHLLQGMAGLPGDVHDRLNAQLASLHRAPVDEVQVEALVDVINVLLGRAEPDDLSGEETDDHRTVAPLHFLDALGLEPTAADVHITNLSDRAFPGKASAIGWPFRTARIQGAGDEAHPATVLRDIREATAPASDLYLLWLALQGVEDGGSVALSHIAELDRQPQNPSAVVSLLTEPAGVPQSVRDRVGGVPVQRAATAPSLEPAWAVPSPGRTHRHEAARIALQALDPRVAAAHASCPRRLALQWLLGQTASHRAEHHQVMLLGNVLGLLERSQPDVFAQYGASIEQDVWPHLTDAERVSSRHKAVISNGKGGAEPEWLLTLAGARNRPDPSSAAYRAAVRREAPELGEIAHGLLPEPRTTMACADCPVRDRCHRSS